MVLVHGSVIAPEDITLLTRDGTPGSEERRQISLINRIAEENGRNIGEYWPGAPLASRRDVKDWMEKFLLGCQVSRF
jgi:hypothetical protein